MRYNISASALLSKLSLGIYGVNRSKTVCSLNEYDLRLMILNNDWVELKYTNSKLCNAWRLWWDIILVKIGPFEEKSHVVNLFR